MEEAEVDEEAKKESEPETEREPTDDFFPLLRMMQHKELLMMVRLLSIAKYGALHLLLHLHLHLHLHLVAGCRGCPVLGPPPSPPGPQDGLQAPEGHH